MDNLIACDEMVLRNVYAIIQISLPYVLFHDTGLILLRCNSNSQIYNSYIIISPQFNFPYRIIISLYFYFSLSNLLFRRHSIQKKWYIYN